MADASSIAGYIRDRYRRLFFIYYNTGNVGIGTVTPNELFHLHKNANSADVRMILTDNTSTASATRGFHIIKATSNDAYIYNYENTAMVFGTNSAERMRITSTGNVMIGGNVNVGSSTNAILHVYGSDPNNVVGCFKHPNNSQGIGIGWDAIFALGNGSGTVGGGNQHIRLVPLGSGVVNVQGNLTATGTKSWIIKHPILENKDLMHVCIEGPRADNLYRGRKQLVNGECEVNLDLECNTTGGMTEGTFVLINKNIQVFVNNNETFDKVVGKVVGNKIIVECDNANASCFIDWLVIGERNDNEIINNLNTSSSGSVIVEIDRVFQQMQENIPSTSNTSNVY